MGTQSYKDLVVWQKSIELVIVVYERTKEFPNEERYGLTPQMRRCGISIPSNIEEGYKRMNLGEYIHFLSISEASAAELETQTVIAKRIYPHVDYQTIESLLNEVQRMLAVMIQKLNAKR